MITIWKLGKVSAGGSKPHEIQFVFTITMQSTPALQQKSNAVSFSE